MDKHPKQLTLFECAQQASKRPRIGSFCDPMDFIVCDTDISEDQAEDITEVTEATYRAK